MRQATRMLASRGLEWGDVAELAMRARPANDQGPRTAQPAANPYAQSRPQPRPEPKPEPRPKPRRVTISEHSIPQRIQGQIVMATLERTSSGGNMSVFFVQDGGTLYGPLVAYTDERVMRVHRLSAKQARVEIGLLKPGQGRYTSSGFMPQAGTLQELS